MPIHGFSNLKPRYSSADAFALRKKYNSRRMDQKRVFTVTAILAAASLSPAATSEAHDLFLRAAHALYDFAHLR
jgi:hypothetical protein